MEKSIETKGAETARDLDNLPPRVRERIERGDAFGPPRTRQPKINLREFVKTLQQR